MRKNNRMQKLLTVTLSVALALTPITSFAEDAWELSDGEEIIYSGTENIPDSMAGEDSEAWQENFSAEEFTNGSEDEAINEDVLSDGELTFEEAASEDAYQENEEELDYILGRPMTEEEIARQLAPFENLNAIPIPDAPESELPYEIAMVGDSAYPESYDARSYGYVTSVKNQTGYDLCWAFVTASLMETSLLKNGYGAYDLSESQLAYLWSYRVADAMGNSEGDTNIKLNSTYTGGGNPYLAALHLSTWSGMALEASYPLSTQWSSALAQTAAYDTVAWLQDAVFSDYSVSRVKSLVMEYGSAGVLINNQASYLNASTGAYSYPVSGNGVNHAVTIVGWDDSYSQENFSAASNVTSDGAWIVKNSWGESWGDGGFYYVSYEDQSLTSIMAVKATTNENYQNNYFYDGSAGLSLLNVSAGQSVANIFKTEAQDGYDEILGEVTLAARNDNVTFGIQVYTNLTDLTNPLSGTAAYTNPYQVTQKYAGIHTASIPEVTLKSGTYYSVVVTNLKGSTIGYYVERFYNYSWYTASASIESGQGFLVAADGSGYRDLSTFVASGTAAPLTPRIKAHTRTGNRTLALHADDLVVLETKTAQLTITANQDYDRELTYTSSDSSVATVDENGKVTGISEGTATITVTAVNNSGTSTACTVTVTPVNLSADDFTLTAGKSAVLNISQSPEIFYSGSYSYTSSNTAAATVSSSGTVTGVAPGTAKITVSTKGEYIKTTECTVTVIAPTVSAPQRIKVETTGTRSYEISWSSVSGVQGYTVYRTSGSETAARAVGTVRSTASGTLSLTDDKTSGSNAVQANTEYTYYVRAFVTINGNNYYSGSSPAAVNGLAQLRLFNWATGEHLYTGSENEKNVQTAGTWNYEGISWITPASTGRPVYRLFNPNSGEHLYTVDQNEKNVLSAGEWNYEGIAWYSDPDQGKPVYRLFNPATDSAVASHHYTADTNERRVLLLNGWRDEGIAWYGISSDWITR